MAQTTKLFSLQTLMPDGLQAHKANDEQIEQFVRFTSALDEGALGAVSRSIQRHYDAAAIERFYRDYYDIYDALSDEAPAHVQAFADSLFRE
jgi:hypothetical protein